MKRRKIACLMLWLVLIFTYIMDGSYEMGIALACYSLICILSGIFCILSGKDLRAEIQMPYGVEKGGTVQIRLTVHNDSGIPVLQGECWVLWENTLTGENGEIMCPFGVMPGKSAEAELLVETEFCGQLKVQIKDVRVFDMFRIYAKGRTVEASDSTLIFPEGREGALDIEKKDAYDMESFRYSDEKKGDDSSEIFDIREYVHGDSMRKIHWKLTGKIGELMVKESSYPVFDSIMMILETGREADKLMDPGRMDGAVEMLFSIAGDFLEKETPFEIGIYDYDRNHFFSQRVEDTDGLWLAMHEVLAAGRAVSCHSAYYQYLANAGGKRFAQYIYIAADESYSNVDSMAETENITVIRQKAEI